MTYKRDPRCFVLSLASAVVFSVHKRSIIDLLYKSIDTYRNLQWHRTVLPVIARLSSDCSRNNELFDTFTFMLLIM